MTAYSYNVNLCLAPPHDTFWRVYEELGAEVFPIPRSKMTGGEKRVDTKLSSDMVIEIALKHVSSPFHMIMAVGTGDLDLLSPIKGEPPKAARGHATLVHPV